MSLYAKLQAAGCELDHHESDLYVKASEAARMLIKAEQRVCPSVQMQYFRSELDGAMWIDVPFHWEPFWAAVRDRETVLA